MSERKTPDVRRLHGEELASHMPNFALIVAAALGTVIDSPENVPMLARFITTSEYLKQFPWCAEYEGSGISALSGVSASIEVALEMHRVGQGPQEPVLDQGMAIEQAATMVDDWRPRLREGVQQAIKNKRRLEHLAFNLMCGGVDVTTVTEQDAVLHAAQALDYYASRRYHLDSSDPW